MFIQTEQTPNPATLKFLPGRSVLGGADPLDFASPDAAAASPLAAALFDVDGVTSVFLGADFISVSKQDDREWYVMKPSILGVIMEHFTAGRPVLATGAEHVGEPAEESATYDPEDEAVVGQIRELLETRVRPAVAQDGGDIVFHGFKEGVVFLTMRGACAGCPSSTATLKMGIENMLRHYIPEVTEVRAAS
ncbi:NifU family protein [Rhodospirillaceae bacterium KN72]|uniref:NifU family protein n=1 Tax=Pacificispira spongiicola TaxID=2729598 RepID=A0A7Y0E0P4_9PROT|nr:NifU family protein [Pacificispira spongiicola]NMM44988.1 NifU family protein [Pacificispira spongiicola]